MTLHSLPVGAGRTGSGAPAAFAAAFAAKSLPATACCILFWVCDHTHQLSIQEPPDRADIPATEQHHFGEGQCLHVWRACMQPMG